MAEGHLWWGHAWHVVCMPGECGRGCVRQEGVSAGEMATEASGIHTFFLTMRKVDYQNSR